MIVYQDMRDWLTSQPQIRKVYDEVPQPKLEMYEDADSTEPNETLFIGYIPVSMAKQILEEKGLLNQGYSDL